MKKTMFFRASAAILSLGSAWVIAGAPLRNILLAATGHDFTILGDL